MSTLKTNQCSVYINHHTHSITFPYTRNGPVDAQRIQYETLLNTVQMSMRKKTDNDSFTIYIQQITILICLWHKHNHNSPTTNILLLMKLVITFNTRTTAVYMKPSFHHTSQTILKICMSNQKQ